MQFSSNDMDELFRKAADNYPLKTDNADWEKISKALDDPENEKPAGGFSFGRAAVAVILLIVLAGSTWYFTKSDSTEEKTPLVQNKKTVSEQNKISDSKKSTTLNEQTIVDNNIPIVSKPSITVNEKNTVNNLRSVPVKMSASGGTSKPADLSFKTLAQQNNTNTTVIDQENKNSWSNDKSNKNANTEILSANEPLKKAAETISENKKTETKKQGEENSTTVTVKAKKGRTSTFYLVAGAAIDKSHIAMQRFSKWGSSFGVTAGYNLNARLSIEAGVLSSTKKYYTGAQYFNVSKLAYSSAAKWKYFDGECRMIEIPVVVRYNFDATKNAQWFLTSGVSSYLMRKEIYDYEYEWYGQTKVGTHEYKNSAKNWISSIHVSGGVERQLFKNASLRIEPYVRIPIKKMGYGDLPISSAGLNIGYRHNIF
jgi:hypothetical protein